MVFPTSHTGLTAPVNQGQPGNQGQESGAESRPVGPARYPEVYASVRVVENWELMRMAEETSKEEVKSSQLAYDILTKERARNMLYESSLTCKGRTEGMYQVMLAWKEWCNGLALVGDITKYLRKHGFRDLAESFPP